jgi:head-tail adaptor
MSPSPYESSRRRWQIAVERNTPTPDDFGHNIDSWANLCSPWANIVFGSGQERREAAQKAASAPATFYILRSAVTATIGVKDRIVFDGANWDIHSAVPSRDQNVGYEIVATRVLA